MLPPAPEQNSQTTLRALTQYPTDRFISLHHKFHSTCTSKTSVIVKTHHLILLLTAVFTVDIPKYSCVEMSKICSVQEVINYRLCSERSYIYFCGISGLSRVRNQTESTRSLRNATLTLGAVQITLTKKTLLCQWPNERSLLPASMTHAQNIHYEPKKKCLNDKWHLSALGSRLF